MKQNIPIEIIIEKIEKWWNNCKVVIGTKDDKYICISREEIDKLIGEIGL